MQKYRKVIYALWRISIYIWFIVYGIRLFQYRSQFINDLIKSEGYNMVLFIIIGVAVIFNILESIAQHKEKRK